MDTNLYNFLSYMTRGKPGYINCIPYDLLENVNTKIFPMYIVVNSQSSMEPGEHWIAIYIPKRGPIKFYCSYGMGIDYYHETVKLFLNKFNRKIIENFRRLQSFNTDVCGQYALYFLYMQLHGCCIMS